jgi:hypothetical protein
MARAKGRRGHAVWQIENGVHVDVAERKIKGLQLAAQAFYRLCGGRAACRAPFARDRFGALGGTLPTGGTTPGVPIGPSPPSRAPHPVDPGIRVTPWSRYIEWAVCGASRVKLPGGS